MFEERIVFTLWIDGITVDNDRSHLMPVLEDLILSSKSESCEFGADFEVLAENKSWSKSRAQIAKLWRFTC